MLDLLFATVAAALPLVQTDPAPLADLRSIAAQIDARPQDTVRLQCRIYADTNRAERCVAVAPARYWMIPHSTREAVTSVRPSERWPMSRSA